MSNNKGFIQKAATKSEERIINALNNKFISYRQKYIWQNDDGSYTNSGVVHKVLTDTILLNHVRKTDTIGVFSGEKSAKFMIFDIDMKDKSEGSKRFAVVQVKQRLVELGISPSFIHVIFSGNKGYHILLLFDDLVGLTFIRSLYEYIIYKTKYSKKEVELRPQPRIGVKLPLSIHKVTGNTCSFVDHNFNLITDKFYIEEIMQFSRDLFIDIVRDMEKECSLDIKLSKKREELAIKYKEPDCFKLYTDLDFTNEKARFIEENGIQHKSSRHNDLLLLSMYYNTQGYNEYEITDKLLEWMEKQDSNKYSSSWTECVNDIEGIVKWTINKNACLRNQDINIEVYLEEIEKIIELPRYTQQIMTYALLCHSKRYATSTGIFYMTYDQIMDATGIASKETVSRLIKQLEFDGFIQIVSSDIPLTPNKYKVLIRADENIKQSKIEVEFNDNVINIEQNYKNTLFTVYTNKELKRVLNKRCFNRLVS